MLKVTLKRSLIGKPKEHKKILMSLGLKRPNQSTIQKDTPSLRGVIQKVPHLVKVEEIN
ncbi:MAG: 50S ribosomal protein L30 [Nitrospirae bacterium]|nr:50S ribosomal protein L30 [Nitrospirota bacterium]